MSTVNVVFDWLEKINLTEDEASYVNPETFFDTYSVSGFSSILVHKHVAAQVLKSPPAYIKKGSGRVTQYKKRIEEDTLQAVKSSPFIHELIAAPWNTNTNSSGTEPSELLVECGSAECIQWKQNDTVKTKKGSRHSKPPIPTSRQKQESLVGAGAELKYAHNLNHCYYQFKSFTKD